MQKMIAIGGGEIGRPGYKVETLSIDKEIIRLSGKKIQSYSLSQRQVATLKDIAK
jgi:hypothetical protein